MKYLVEIRLKDWFSDVRYPNNVIDIVVVDAWDDIAARFAGYAEFEKKYKNKEIALEGYGLRDVCAPEAILFEEET